MLYIIATPIGNLKDISYRAAKTLSEVDIVLSEDTRSFYRLRKVVEELFGFSFKENQEVVSYYKEKEAEKIPLILDWLKQGKDIALVSESGTPLISDPGSLLVMTVIEEKIPFTFIPGPSAFVSAVVLAGFAFKEIVFLGYFPKKKRRKFLEKIRKAVKILENPIFVFYESPHRIKNTITKILEYFPKKVELCLCREMTKKFEEKLFIKDLKALEKISEKGEFTVVVKILR